jgi:glycosyltransferase involved in cell wall biosynthesis
LEFVVGDDHSELKHYLKLLEEDVDVVVRSTRNRGLGGNNNQVIRQCRGEYIFYLQDDFICQRRGDWMQEALWVLETRPEVGLVLLNAYDSVPRYRLERTPSGRELRRLEFDQPQGSDTHYVYNDGPQLKRRDFHEKVGWYHEDTPVGDVEDFFALKFLQQRIYEVASIDNGADGVVLFSNDNNESTRPDRWRRRWKARLDQHGAGRLIAEFYSVLPVSFRQRLRRNYWVQGPSQEQRLRDAESRRG